MIYSRKELIMPTKLSIHRNNLEFHNTETLVILTVITCLLGGNQKKRPSQWFLGTPIWSQNKWVFRIKPFEKRLSLKVKIVEIISSERNDLDHLFNTSKKYAAGDSPSLASEDAVDEASLFHTWPLEITDLTPYLSPTFYSLWALARSPCPSDPQFAHL